MARHAWGDWARCAWFFVMMPLVTMASFMLLVVGLLLASVWGRRGRARWIHVMAFAWGRIVFRLMPGWRLVMSGVEHARAFAGRPVVVVANHQGNADVPVALQVPVNARFLAKASLFRVPVMGLGMRLAGYIPVNRVDKSSRVDALAAARRVLRSGLAVWFFPEGTRSRDGRIGAFRAGAFRLAIEERVPLLPVVIRGTRELHPRGGLRMGRGLVRVKVLEPVTPAGEESAESFAERVRCLICAEYDSL